VILKAGDTGTANLRVIDTVTGESLCFVQRVNTETGEAWQYAKAPDGRFLHDAQQLVVERCPHPVRVEKIH
jgi:hypothetical protein